MLPAGVFFGTDGAAKTSQLDLTLVGPDDNPRSFELFWKGDTGPRSVALKPSRLLFDKKRMLVWEADAPKDLLVETIRIDVDALQTMGTVKIEGLDAKGWRVLAENAALYSTGGRFAAEIIIKPAIYEKLRLSFKGYDKRFRETTLPVTSVTLSGKNAAQDLRSAVRAAQVLGQDRRPRSSPRCHPAGPGALDQEHRARDGGAVPGQLGAGRPRW